jgi:hypothetical protein
LLPTLLLTISEAATDPAVNSTSDVPDSFAPEHEKLWPESSIPETNSESLPNDTDMPIIPPKSNHTKSSKPKHASATDGPVFTDFSWKEMGDAREEKKVKGEAAFYRGRPLRCLLCEFTHPSIAGSSGAMMDHVRTMHAGCSAEVQAAKKVLVDGWESARQEKLGGDV